MCPNKRKPAKNSTTAQARWRQRQLDDLKCGYCGKPNDTLRVGCKVCSVFRAKVYRYHRHFMKDFK